MTTSSPTNTDYTQEVRFAVVMYGGVSLAIYINGIAQELLSMVRSTPEPKNDKGVPTATVEPGDLKGTQRVYKKLSHLLSDERLLAECRAVAPKKGTDQSCAALTDKLEELLADSDAPQTRLVVDILSGTSAGGINAIYLAKALVNDQSIDQLKQLWINEGDIGLLINDKNSVMGLHLENQKPPQSLLNSRRMYLKLLKSLDDMDDGDRRAQDFRSPYVDELDLYITATDIEGAPVPIKLSDAVVYERRHRNVFHFKYGSAEAMGDQCNDFISENNPFMAFTARCTSSFPFAFEPMRLCDIDEVVATFKNYQGADQEKMKEKWERFFSENTGANGGQKICYTTRSFGDGGYLDNKPFTYATETLARRYAPRPVDRKLIYIEPSPEHPEDEVIKNAKPDAIENVKAALLDLPSYETIREDLQRLIQRNVLINRLNRITSAVEADMDRARWPRPKMEPGEWETLDLAGMVKKFGVYYLPYRRLRIAAVTDQLAELIARVRNLDQDSAQFFAVRVLIRAWREKYYPDYHRKVAATEQPDQAAEPPAPAAPGETAVTANADAKTDYTSNQLLVHYDYNYWLRRMNFIRRRLDQLLKLKKLPARNEKTGEGVDEKRINKEEAAVLERLKKLAHNPLDYADLTAEQKSSLHSFLIFVKCQLNLIYKDLRQAGRRIQSTHHADGDDSVAGKIKKISLGPDKIRLLLGLPQESDSTEPDFSRLNEEECVKRATRLFDDPAFAQSFQDAADELREQLKQTVVDPTWLHCRQLLRATETLPQGDKSCPLPDPLSAHSNSVREYLWRYCSQFDDFDQITFPIAYGTDVGEANVVEVIRISPEDAVNLINERREQRDSPDGTGRRKLAGTALHHFGAFLDRTWRQNDIMWGRLDGAERVITALLPDPINEGVRNELIRQAHTAILIEELPIENRKELRTLMSHALVRASAGEPIRAAVEKVVKAASGDSSVQKRLEKLICNSLEDEELLNFITTGYEVNRQLDAKTMLRAVSRSTQVVGHILEDIANHNALDGKSLAWIARLGQVFWGLVEVAVPNSILNLLMFHWLKVLYVLELLLLIACFLFSAPPDLQNFAWKIFGITIAVNLAVLLLRDKMRGRKGWKYALGVIVVGLFIVLAAVGAGDLFGLGLSTKIQAWLKPLSNWLAAARLWVKPLGDLLARIR
jgi:patatin-related protein